MAARAQLSAYGTIPYLPDSRLWALGGCFGVIHDNNIITSTWKTSISIIDPNRSLKNHNGRAAETTP